MVTWFPSGRAAGSRRAEVVAAFLSPGPSGVAARRLLPFVVAAPLVVGWLCLQGQRRGQYDAAVAVALFAVANVLILSAVIGSTALKLHRVERARRATEEALRASEERFRSVAETLPEVIAVVDAGGIVEYCSPYYFRYTGQTAEEMAGDGWAQALHPDDAAGSLAAWKGALATGRGYELDQRMRRADGVYRWHLVRTVPLFDGENRVSKWVATVTDVDDRKRAAAEVLTHTERLQASNRELASFAYVASHDLQEPLRTLSGFSELLAERCRGKLDAEADELLGFIQAGAARMQALIQGLLAYSRVETQGAQLAGVDSGRLLDDVLRDLATAVRESGAVITRGALPVVRADAQQLAQVFRHLLSNALQFRRVEGAPRVHVESGTKGKWSCFTVSDNGIGIDPQHFERIFVLFQRLHSRDEHGGIGIGLAICKRVVERHGGRIWVESRPGGGSNFCFTLAGPEESPQ